MPRKYPPQLSLLARLDREAHTRAVLTEQQQQKLVKMLAELLLQAAKLAGPSGAAEGHDE